MPARPVPLPPPTAPDTQCTVATRSTQTRCLEAYIHAGPLRQQRARARSARSEASASVGPLVYVRHIVSILDASWLVTSPLPSPSAQSSSSAALLLPPTVTPKLLASATTHFRRLTRCAAEWLPGVWQQDLPWAEGNGLSVGKEVQVGERFERG